MDGEALILIKVWSATLVALSYSYFIASKIPKGKLRFLSLLPIFSLFFILPLFLSAVFPIGITTFFISGLANSKLILFAFDLGPLCSTPPKNFFIFVIIACLPIKIKSENQYPSSKKTKLPFNFAAKVLFLALLIGLFDYKKVVHPSVALVIYSCMVFLFVEVVLVVPNTLVKFLTGLELEPPSDEPYLSTSLQDFWGRRWNLMVSNALRYTVYKPVRSFSATLIGSAWAPLPGVLATFLVSGLMHELLYFYITRAPPTWEVTCFFLLHAVCLVIEFGLKKACGKGRFELHWAISCVLTVGFVIVTAFWLFFPPLLRAGVDVRAINETKMLFHFVSHKLNLKA